jgi:hypothetical protein
MLLTVFWSCRPQGAHTDGLAGHRGHNIGRAARDRIPDMSLGLADHRELTLLGLGSCRPQGAHTDGLAGHKGTHWVAPCPRFVCRLWSRRPQRGLWFAHAGFRPSGVLHQGPLASGHWGYVCLGSCPSLRKRKVEDLGSQPVTRWIHARSCDPWLTDALSSSRPWVCQSGINARSIFTPPQEEGRRPRLAAICKEGACSQL